jgi:hypothetical protein
VESPPDVTVDARFRLPVKGQDGLYRYTERPVSRRRMSYGYSQRNYGSEVILFRYISLLLYIAVYGMNYYHFIITISTVIILMFSIVIIIMICNYTVPCL